MMQYAKFLFFLCVSITLAGCITGPVITHEIIYDRFDDKNLDISWVEEYPRKEVRFLSGENILQGFIYGKENNKGLIVFSIGFHSSADHYGRIIGYLIDEGWRVFTYNGTGVAGSEGRSMRGVSQTVIDLKSAMHYVENTNDFNDLPVILMGFSMGGYAVCAFLNFDYNVDAVVTICAFNSVKEMIKFQGTNYLGIFYYPIYLIYPPIYSQTFLQIWLLQKIRFGELANLTAVDGINNTQIPVLIMADSNDDLFPPDKIGIYAYKESITNPHVEYIYLEGENANGHNFPRTETFPMIGEFLERVLTN